MSVPQGLFAMTGVQHVLSGRFTLGHGVRPASGMLEIALQDVPLPATGDLTIRYETETIVLRECRLTQPAMRAEESVTVRVMIEDRRWKWAYCEPISGLYNQRDENGRLDETTEKTPRELAVLLLEKMGEHGYSVADLPEFSRPAMDWDYASPAEELARLCDQLGCRVVLGLENTVSLRVAGAGAALPTDVPILTDSLGLDDRSRPDSLLIVGSARRVQSRFRLEAVGLDRDGQVRPLEELSYRPESGWQNVYPESFSQVTAESDRRLAASSVYRWYRVVSSVQIDLAAGESGVGSGGSGEAIRYEIPTLGTAVQREAVLPLQDCLFETVEIAERVSRPRPCRVFGEFIRGALLPNWSETLAEQEWQAGFQIDRERGIVRLTTPAVRLSAAGLIEPARLFLETVHPWRRDEESQLDRWTWRGDLPGEECGTGPAVLKREEFAATLQVQYDGSGLTPTGEVSSNADELDSVAEELCALVSTQWAASETREILYAGLMAIEPDGAIRQVQWNAGPEGMQTRAVRNSEFDRSVLRHAEQRLWDQVMSAVVDREVQRSGRRQGRLMLREVWS